MKVVWPYLLASVAMSAAVRYMDIQLPFEILIGAVVFAALVLVLRPKFVLSVVKSLWKKSSK